MSLTKSFKIKKRLGAAQEGSGPSELDSGSLHRGSCGRSVGKH